VDTLCMDDDLSYRPWYDNNSYCLCLLWQLHALSALQQQCATPLMTSGASPRARRSSSPVLAPPLPACLRVRYREAVVAVCQRNL
jgi:hypothetical protein